MARVRESLSSRPDVQGSVPEGRNLAEKRNLVSKVNAYSPQTKSY